MKFSLSLYEHQRNKITKDIGKLLSSKCRDILLAVGVPVILEWHFVTPFYRDRRILQHATSKTKEVPNIKKGTPKEYNHIGDDFKIVIKEADDFRIEISQVIRSRLTDSKISIMAQSKTTFDWNACPSEKVQNIKTKIKAVLNPKKDDDEQYRELVNLYIQYYMRGIEILQMLQTNFNELYEQLYTLEQSCRLDDLNILFRELDMLSSKWKDYLERKSSLPKEKFTKEDKEKIAKFEEIFKNNLRKYGYKSVSNVNEIKISPDTFLPVIDNFDMKFDSSASDNIRGIWAFTMALLQTSNLKLGNHPGLLIFDEPDQHSIVISDMEAFFEDIINVKGFRQVIVGITIKDADTNEAINTIQGDFKIINITDRSFMPISVD